MRSKFFRETLRGINASTTFLAGIMITSHTGLELAGIALILCAVGQFSTVYDAR